MSSDAQTRFQPAADSRAAPARRTLKGHPLSIIKWINCIQEAILSIYNDLSNEELLTRCIGGFTQNANESFNNMVWKIASKRTFSGQEIVEIATYLSAATFNDGCKALLFLLEEIGVKVGARAEAVCALVDQKRLHDADISLQNRSKTGRIQRRINQQRQADAEEALQTSYYSAGVH